MDTGTLALLIPIIGVSIPIVAIWTKHRKDVLQMEIEATPTARRKKNESWAPGAPRLAPLGLA